MKSEAHNGRVAELTGNGHEGEAHATQKAEEKGI